MSDTSQPTSPAPSKPDETKVPILHIPADVFDRISSALYIAGVEDGYRVGKGLGKTGEDEAITNLKPMKYRSTLAAKLGRKELELLTKK